MTPRPLTLAEQIAIHRRGLSAVEQARADAAVATVLARVARQTVWKAYLKAGAE